jgi:hypothetical protein
MHRRTGVVSVRQLHVHIGHIRATAARPVHGRLSVVYRVPCILHRLLVHCRQFICARTTGCVKVSGV